MRLECDSTLSFSREAQVCILYVDLTVSPKIWSEYSLIDMEQIGVGKFFYFLVVAFNATGYANFSTDL